jgi:cell division protein FtsB
MSNASVQTAPAPSGDATSADSRRSRCVARRRLLLLGFFLLLVAVGAAANYGPIRHYLDARARLERVAEQVAGLEEQKAALQAELAKLSEAGYLEGLAREELTYARPDEELYIVAEPTGGPLVAGTHAGSDTSAGVAGATTRRAGAEAAGVAEDAGAVGSGASEPGETAKQSRIPSAGIGAGVPGADFVIGYGIGVAAPGFERSGREGADEAGLLERIVTAISGLF